MAINKNEMISRKYNIIKCWLYDVTNGGTYLYLCEWNIFDKCRYCML